MNNLIKKVCINIMIGIGLLAAVNVNAATLTVGSQALVFGNQQIGTSSTPHNVTLTATGGTVNFYALGIDSPNFSLLLNDCGASLTVAASPCTLQVKYNPLQAGTRYAELLIRSDATNTDYVPGASCGAPTATASYYYCVQHVYLQGSATGVPDAPTSVAASAGNAQATITFSAPSDNGSAITLYTATANPGGATGSCNGPAVCPINVSGLANGTPYTFTVTATNGLGVGSVSAASIPVTPKLPQTITFNQPASNTFGTLTATATSGLAVTFAASVGTPACTITAGGALTPVSAGNCTITASQTGDGTYAAATPVSMTYAIGANNANVITFNNPGTQSMGTTPTLTATATSGLAVTFAHSPAAVCTIDVNTGALTPVSVGSCTITVSQAGNAVFQAAVPVSRTFSINTLTLQTITFAPPGDKNMGTSPTLTATATSGLAVTFDSLTQAACTITPSGVLMPVAIGTNNCTITASQVGNGTYAVASSVPQTFSILAVSQTITFAPPGNKNMGTTPTLTATATSGLAVTFASSTALVCTIAGGVLTPVSVGSCTITASQVGNGTYAAAAPVPQTFNILAASSCPAPGVSMISDTWTWQAALIGINKGFVLAPNQGLAIQFTTGASGTGTLNNVETVSSPAADRYVTLSTCPGDFTVTAPGCKRAGSPLSANLRFTVGPASSGTCGLSPNTTYYFNIRHATQVVGSNPIQLLESCPIATGCGFWQQMNHN